MSAKGSRVIFEQAGSANPPRLSVQGRAATMGAPQFCAEGCGRRWVAQLMQRVTHNSSRDGGGCVLSAAPRSGRRCVGDPPRGVRAVLGLDFPVLKFEHELLGLCARRPSVEGSAALAQNWTRLRGETGGRQWRPLRLMKRPDGRA